MSTTTKKTKKTKGLNDAVKPEKKKYSEAQKNRVIKELSEITNRNMTRKYLMDFALGRR